MHRSSIYIYESKMFGTHIHDHTYTVKTYTDILQVYSVQSILIIVHLCVYIYVRGDSFEAWQPQHNFRPHGSQRSVRLEWTAVIRTILRLSDRAAATAPPPPPPPPPPPMPPMPQRPVAGAPPAAGVQLPQTPALQQGQQGSAASAAQYPAEPQGKSAGEVRAESAASAVSGKGIVLEQGKAEDMPLAGQGIVLPTSRGRGREPAQGDNKTLDSVTPTLIRRPAQGAKGTGEEGASAESAALGAPFESAAWVQQSVSDSNAISARLDEIVERLQCFDEIQERLQVLEQRTAEILGLLITLIPAESV